MPNNVPVGWLLFGYSGGSFCPYAILPEVCAAAFFPMFHVILNPLEANALATIAASCEN